MHVSKPSFICYEFHPQLKVYTRTKVSAETSTTQPSPIRLGQAYYEINIWVWLKDSLDPFKMRNSLEFEPWGESITNGFILIHLIAKKGKENGWLRRWERGGWFYPHSPSWKKNGFEREEEDGMDGFIHIHPIAKKERKKRFEI